MNDVACNVAISSSENYIDEETGLLYISLK